MEVEASAPERTKFVDASTFRRVARSLVTSVSIVSAVDEAERDAGMTASSLCMVSMNPPLLLVCVDKRVPTLQALDVDSDFVVNVLAAGQEEIALHFARPSADKFEGISTTRCALSGVQTVDDAAARIGCCVEQIHDAGDHVIVVGSIQNAYVDQDCRPVSYHDSRFWRLSPHGPDRSHLFDSITLM